MQQLWDRAEANGYAHHMTSDPIANTPAHEVLLHVGLGDHQVAQASAEVEARTIGARIRPTPVDADRTIDVDPFYAIPRIESYPFSGSALEIWDSGATPVPPAANVPPRARRGPARGAAQHQDRPRAEERLLPARRQDHRHLLRAAVLLTRLQGLRVAAGCGPRAGALTQSAPHSGR